MKKLQINQFRNDFLVFSILLKNERKQFELRYRRCFLFFNSFLEELKIPKSPFEINRLLERMENLNVVCFALTVQDIQ